MSDYSDDDPNPNDFPPDQVFSSLQEFITLLRVYLGESLKVARVEQALKSPGEDVDDIFNFLAGEPWRTLFVLADSVDFPRKPEPKMSVVAGVGGPKFSAWSLGGSFTLNNKTYHRIVVFSNATVSHQAVYQLMGGGDRSCDVTGSLNGMTRYNASVVRPPHALVGVARPTYYTGNDWQICAILGCNDVPVTSKILTVLVHLFPYAAGNIGKIAKRMPYSVLATRAGLTPEGHKTGNKSNDTTTYQIRIALFCFLPAYSNEKKFKKQVIARFKAVCASLGMGETPEADCEAQINTCAMTVNAIGGIVYTCLGYVLAIGNDKKYKLNVRYEHLPAIDVLVLETNMTKWAGEVLTQMRLIYADHHLSTVSKAALVMKVLSDHEITINPRWLDEKEKLRIAETLFKHSPFFGLVQSQHEALRVALFPNLSYLGLLYHGAALKGDEAKEWEDYNVKGVAAHVGSALDRARVERFASLLPDPHVVDLMRDCKDSAPAEVDVQIERLPDPKKGREELYALMHIKERNAPWYLKELGQRQKKQREIYQPLLRNAILDAWNPKKSLANSKMNIEVSVIRRGEILAKIAEADEAINEMIRNIVPPGDTLSDPTDHTVANIKVEMELLLTAALRVISAFNINEL